MTASPDLDPVIHAQARLRVMVALTELDEAAQISFPRLQEILGMTAGNLSTHLRKLEDAGYVAIVKTHEGRSPVTFLSPTPLGRRAFEEYTARLRILLDGAEYS